MKIRPPKRPRYWNGYSAKGEAWEISHFEFEKKMADKFDPVADSEPGDMYYGI